MKAYYHRTRQQRLKEIIIGQTLVTLLIIVVSIFMIFASFGLRVNWERFSILHTGVVYLSYYPADSVVFVDGKEYREKSNFDIQLLPGQYDIVVSKEGYSTWKHRAKIVADRVTYYKNIVLFKSKPEISIVTDNNTISSIDTTTDSANNTDELSHNDHEIWIGKNLVTRLSNQISGVIWYSGSQYIAYQQGDEIRIICRDGSNDTLLIKLSSSDKTKFFFSWDGTYLFYKDGVIYKRATIK